MNRNHWIAALLAALPMLATPVGAWQPLGPYADSRWEVPPRIYGYPLDDDGAMFYGGGRYRQYYGFGRGYFLADYPGPVPDYWGHQWMRHKYWPFDSRKLPGVYVPEQYANCAIIILQVPPEAEVWLEGKTTKQTGTTRMYYSPPLPPKQSFAYQVRVSWRDASGMHQQSQDVAVQAGAKVQLAFPQQPKTEQVSFTPAFKPVPQK